MRCMRVRGRLSAYLDREVSLEVRLKMERHLGSCENCRQFLEGMGQLSVLLEGYPVPEPPEALTSRVLERARTKMDVRRVIEGRSSKPLGWWQALPVSSRLGSTVTDEHVSSDPLVLYRVLGENDTPQGNILRAVKAVSFVDLMF